MKLHLEPQYFVGFSNLSAVARSSSRNFVKNDENRSLRQKIFSEIVQQSRHVTYRETDACLGISSTFKKSILHVY